MTREQLEEIKKHVEAVQTPRLVLRLLLERERLHEAASNVRISMLICLREEEPPTLATLDEYARLLLAAIAFVEEEA